MGLNALHKLIKSILKAESLSMFLQFEVHYNL